MNLEHVRDLLTAPIRPEVKIRDGLRSASVMVIIYGNPPRVLMTERPEGMRRHSGEISFPGGSVEPSDLDLLGTAIRETQEEIGLSIGRGEVTGQLDTVVTLNSGFGIIPFVAVRDELGSPRVGCEVASILEIPLVPLLRTEAADDDPAHHRIMEMYTFTYRAKTIWGASARILHQISARLG